MCIKVTNEHPEPTGIGWKVFQKDDRYLTGMCVGRIIRRPTKRWIHEKNYRGLGLWKDPEDYGFGWHICTTLEDAYSWKSGGYKTIRKVRYRGASVSGTFMSDQSIIVVAKEILILPGEVK